MTLEQLRLAHPRLVYKSYHLARTDETYTISYEFLLEPDIVFRPVTTIQIKNSVNDDAFVQYAFNLGMVEAISYWKTACPAELVVEAGPLSADQIRFWQDLMIHGLGEFFYQNKIDFTQPEFFKIISSPRSEIANENGDFTSSEAQHFTRAQHGGDLVLVGGGKDTAVTLGILTANQVPFQTLVVNPTVASVANIKAAGAPDPIVVKRVIDPKLLELNKSGYLNGHTPFSAYLAFLGIAVASLYGNPRVLVSNERSADFGNVVYHGMEVNHQYSKSFRFEQQFRAYAQEYLGGSAQYFSLLRPFNDIQLAMLFAKRSDFFTTFRSCNVGSKTNTWCGKCAKCAFTYLVLYPFMRHEQMVISFGGDLFVVPEIIGFIKELVGLSQFKPFECVGTPEEAKLALVMSVAKYLSEKREVPEGLLTIKSELALGVADVADLKKTVIDQWSDTYNVPQEYLSMLRNTWDEVKSKD